MNIKHIAHGPNFSIFFWCGRVLWGSRYFGLLTGEARPVGWSLGGPDASSSLPGIGVTRCEIFLTISILSWPIFSDQTPFSAAAECQVFRSKCFYFHVVLCLWPAQWERKYCHWYCSVESLINEVKEYQTRPCSMHNQYEKYVLQDIKSIRWRTQWKY